jgi:hypothetical protein
MGRPKGSRNKRLTDLTGMTFGAYEVLYECERRKNNARVWMCKCKCDREAEVYHTNLTCRSNQMCKYCTYESYKVSEMHKTMKNVYDGMIGRCFLTADSDRYDYYGGRGITVDEAWLGEHGFQQFWRDVGDRPEGTSLDRINPNGNYCKENCRWVSSGEQAYNKRRLERNTSGRTGISWNSKLDKWEAYIGVKGEIIRLGVFANFEDAVKAREEAELKYYRYTKE